jgi:hypothetical protein
MIYDALHPIRESRAPEPPLPYFLAHIAVSALLTAGALWLMRRRGDGLAEFLFFAALVQLVIPILPVSRPHYYVCGALILAGLSAAQWPRRQGLWGGWPLAVGAGACLIAGILDGVDARFALDYGLATLAALYLGLLGLLLARKRAEAGTLQTAASLQPMAG